MTTNELQAADAERFRKIAKEIPGHIDIVTLIAWLKVLGAEGVSSYESNLEAFRKAVDGLQKKTEEYLE